MIRNITIAAAHATAASGRAFQLATPSTMPMIGNVVTAADEIVLCGISRFSFDGPLAGLVLIAAPRPGLGQAPPERLGKAEQRFLEDGHHQPIADRSS